jgi:hypothetical protein
MGANKELVTQAFDSRAAREAYEKAYKRVSASLDDLSSADFSKEFLELEAQLDAGMVEVKTAMLTSGLFSSDDEQALGVWIFRQHARLAQIGARATLSCLNDDKHELSRTMRILALTFLHSGEAVKWELMVGRGGRREYKLGNALMQMAIQRGRQRETGELVVDGMRRWSSIEQLFLRVHFLDRFTSGNLTRQQIEVLDAWLWEWAPALTGTPRYPGGVVLRVDLDCDHGMRYGRRKNSERPTLYLQLAPLEERRKEVIKEMHHGRTVPTKGRASNIRVEAHVAVLLQLRTLFAGGGSEGSPRAARQATTPVPVEVVVGLAEITRELSGAKPPSASSIPPLELSPQAARPARKDEYASVYDKPRRVMILKNASATGYLLEATAKDSAALGDLLGLRVGEGQPMVLARVVRRVNELGRGIQLGVQLMSDTSWPMRVAALESADGQPEQFVFVPGPDGSGRFDSFAVPYSALKDDARYRVLAGGEEYTLAFNRVRRRGRGWALAGFEIVERLVR